MDLKKYQQETFKNYLENPQKFEGIDRAKLLDIFLNKSSSITTRSKNLVEKTYTNRAAKVIESIKNNNEAEFNKIMNV